MFGRSLLNPSVAYGGENDKNSVCSNCGRHKGRFASNRRLTVAVLKKLAKANVLCLAEGYFSEVGTSCKINDFILLNPSNVKVLENL